MMDGEVVGSGGTLLVTPEGQKAAQNSGLPFQEVDLKESKLYENWR